LQYAQGEICIFLDDDAILQNKDALENVLKAFDRPGWYNNREIAMWYLLKYCTIDNLAMQVNALPHKKFHSVKTLLPEFYTYYFAGGAHAIKRKVLLRNRKPTRLFFLWYGRI
jgi:cellulose synthase/poly-beta-1,6-N-acetylglucosamine synthase-like glycosyltransferase